MNLLLDVMGHNTLCKRVHRSGVHGPAPFGLAVAIGHRNPLPVIHGPRPKKLGLHRLINLA